MTPGTFGWSFRSIVSESYGFEVTCAGSRCVGTLTGGAGVIVPWKVEPTTTVIIAFRPSERTSGGIASASAGANSFATDFAAAAERFTRGFQ